MKWIYIADAVYYIFYFDPINIFKNTANNRFARNNTLKLSVTMNTNVFDHGIIIIYVTYPLKERLPLRCTHM